MTGAMTMIEEAAKKTIFDDLPDAEFLFPPEGIISVSKIENPNVDHTASFQF
jgi:hypothetical protein